MQSKELTLAWLHAQKYSLLLWRLHLRRQPDQDHDELKEGACEDFQPDAYDEQTALLRLRIPVPDHLPVGDAQLLLDEGEPR